MKLPVAFSPAQPQVVRIHHVALERIVRRLVAQCHTLPPLSPAEKRLAVRELTRLGI